MSESQKAKPLIWWTQPVPNTGESISQRVWVTLVWGTDPERHDVAFLKRPRWARAVPTSSFACWRLKRLMHTAWDQKAAAEGWTDKLWKAAFRCHFFGMKQQSQTVWEDRHDPAPSLIFKMEKTHDLIWKITHFKPGVSSWCTQLKSKASRFQAIILTGFSYLEDRKRFLGNKFFPPPDY